MQIIEILKEKKTSILRRWRDQIVDTYPKDSRAFFKNQKDRFANPVGHLIERTTEEVFQTVVADDMPVLTTSLEEFIKVRSVQELSPAQAIGFVLKFKDAVRAELKEDIEAKELHHELHNIETRIDKMTLIVFDSYCNARETLFQIKIREIKSQTYTIMNAKPLEPSDSGGG
ncbi:hypothetical protein CEE37_07475 [candidate division LCP-89 bacterium B3_LCP]|uniref:RsbT co-antagonist protein RsbRD N-terminal domain-containing protein n=1 Tax=candidate division LCP-89 bacterium B3_LCP TaxID=2012998 RepID=A0A532V0Q6_UNCL8|nr:MAG: hypothetical protein CEE37_07475 [candidate division LCP-89 bacterium B3_LCP]